MKLQKTHCPTCGEPATGILEALQVTARGDISEDGEFEYSGTTDVHWNNQKTHLDENGEATLGCDNGHEWKSPILEE